MEFESIRSIRVPRERLAEVGAIVRREATRLTDIALIADKGLQTEFREALTGIRRQGRVPVQKREWEVTRRFRFRTVDGQPLGKVKVGLVEGNARELRALEIRGEPLEITEEYGAEFEVDAYRGLMILDRFGYGLVRPRYARRTAATSGEKDAMGRPVERRDNWRIVEVGSVMEERARAAGELAEIGARRGRPRAREAVAETLIATPPTDEV